MTRAERFAAMVEARNRRVLMAAMSLASEQGFGAITRDAIARRAGMASGSVNRAYGTIEAVREEVMREAVRAELLDIVAQGIATGNETARSAPPDLKARALATLT